METTITAEKREITNWINQLEDKSVIDRIYRFMKDFEKPRYDAAYAATLSGKAKIAYWQEVGISGDELLRRVHAHIETLPWKK